MLDTSAVQLLMIVVCCMMQLSHAGQFTEVPQTVNVTAGNDAVFRCLHSDAEFYGWRIDGRSARTANLSEVSVQSNMLTILALPEYNGTVVECIALYSDGTPSQTSPPALLIVQGTCNISNCSNYEDAETTGFIETPTSVTAAVGGTAVFRCRHTGADVIGWTVNGASFGSLRSLNITAGSQPLAGGSVLHTLTIQALAAYNNTNVACIATSFESGSARESTPDATLLIQGALSSIVNLSLHVDFNSSTSSLSWEPPFSLNLTNVEPDVIYCVDVYNATCGRSFLSSDCNVSRPGYVHNQRESGTENELLEFVVTPRSNSANSVNGTPFSVAEEHATFAAVDFEHIVHRDTSVESVYLILNVNLPNKVSGIDDNRYKVSRDYSLLLNSKDRALPDVAQYSTVATPSQSGLVLQFPQRFQYGRLWSGVLMGHQCGGTPLSATFELSTHEVQNFTVDQSVSTAQVGLSWNFIDGSQSMGVLIIAYSLMDNMDIHYNVIPRPSGNTTQRQSTKLSGLLGDRYNISVFALMENGLPFVRAVTEVKTVTVSASRAKNKNKNGGPSFIVTHTVSQNNGTCVTCVIDAGTDDTCILLVHPKVSHTNQPSAGLVNIDSLVLNRSGNMASGCINNVDTATYIITAFLYGGSTGMIHGSPHIIQPQLGSSVTGESFKLLWVVLSSVLASIVIAVAVLNVVIIAVKLRRRSISREKELATEEEGEPVNVTMKRCDAYEVTKLARKKIKTETNPAYEVVKTNARTRS